ncbi:MAG: hypothetical protein ABH952_08175 [Candidatus Omnitrophota bacterium]
MKNLIFACLVLGGTAVVLAIVSRMIMMPLELVPRGIGARGFLVFANTCFLIAILAILLPGKEK